MKTNQNWLYYLHKKMRCGYLQYNMVVYTTLLMVVEIHKQNKARKMGKKCVNGVMVVKETDLNTVNK